MLIPVLPKMKTELGVSQFKISLIITVFSIAAAVSIPVLGYLSDRFSRKAVIIPSLILYGLGGLLAGAAAEWFSNEYMWILVGRVLQGIGAAGTAPIAMALTGDLFKGAEQSKVLGLVEASNGFGKVISPILGFIACHPLLVRSLFRLSDFLSRFHYFDNYLCKGKESRKGTSAPW